MTKIDVLGMEIDLEQLNAYCSAPEKGYIDLFEEHEVHWLNSKGRYFIYRRHPDPDVTVLAMGHLDIAHTPGLDRTKFRHEVKTFKVDPKNPESATYDEDWIMNHNLDDRLGVWAIMAKFPELDIKADLLLLTDEEAGASTAEDFEEWWLSLEPEQRRDYNWMVEFDRHSNDTVFYGYGQATWANPKDFNEWELAAAEFTDTGIGSWSDVACLEKLGVKGVNWAIGYHDEHMHNHYAVLQTTVSQLYGFSHFYHKYKDQKFPHTPKPAAQHGNNGRWNRDLWGDEWDVPRSYGRNASVVKTVLVGACSKCGKIEQLYAPSPNDFQKPRCNTCFQIRFGDRARFVLFEEDQKNYKRDKNQKKDVTVLRPCANCGRYTGRSISVTETKKTEEGTKSVSYYQICEDCSSAFHDLEGIQLMCDICKVRASTLTVTYSDGSWELACQRCADLVEFEEDDQTHNPGVCDWCGIEAPYRFEIKPYAGSPAKNTVCQDCLQVSGFHECSTCGSIEGTVSLVTGTKSEYRCFDCRLDSLQKKNKSDGNLSCDWCGTKTNVLYGGGKEALICQECHEHNRQFDVVSCDNCGESYSVNVLIVVNESKICPTCFNAEYGEG